MAWLLDTNVLSELRKPSPNPNVVRFVALEPLADLYISVVALAEIRYGIELAPDPTLRSHLNDWLASRVRPLFDNQRTLPVSEEVLLKWRLLLEEGRKSGHTFSQPDLLIAATALVHGLTVVTRDTLHFDRAGVPVKNPWSE